MFGSQSYDSLIRFYNGNEERLKDVLVNVLGLKLKQSYRKSEQVLKQLCIVNFLENLKFSDADIKKVMTKKDKLDTKLIVSLAKDNDLDKEKLAIVKLVDEDKLSSDEIVSRTMAYKIDQEKAKYYMLFINGELKDNIDYFGPYLVIRNIARAFGVTRIEESFSEIFADINAKLIAGLEYNSGKIAEDINVLSDKVEAIYNMPLSLYSLVILQMLSDLYIIPNIKKDKLFLLKDPLNAILKYEINNENDLFIKSFTKFFESLNDLNYDNHNEIDRSFKTLKEDLGLFIDLGDKNIRYLLNFILEIVYNKSNSYDFYKKIIDKYFLNN